MISEPGLYYYGIDGNGVGFGGQIFRYPYNDCRTMSNQNIQIRDFFSIASYCDPSLNGMKQPLRLHASELNLLVSGTTAVARAALLLVLRQRLGI